MPKKILNINSLYDFVVKNRPALKGLKFRQSSRDIGGSYGNREIIDIDTSENDLDVIDSILEKYKNKLKQEFGVIVNVLDGEKYKQINVGDFKVRLHYIESASKINWGDMNENIMTLAIGCRFLFKNRNIKKEDYYKLLKYHFKDKINQVTLKSANKNTIIKDDLKIILSDKYREEVYTKRDEKKYIEILGSNIQYVNNSKIKSWSEYLYNNGVKDYIKVESIGKKGEKTDVKVSIKNHDGKFEPVDINISAKLKINQFGQYAGSNYIKLNEFLKNIFGEDIGLEQKYQDTISNVKKEGTIKQNTVRAFNIAYASVFRKSERTISIKTLFDGINKYATSNQNIEIVEIDNGFNVFDFNKLKNLLNNISKDKENAINKKIKLKYSKYGSENLPKIQVYLGKKLLITVRAKYETSGDIFRNYIEKGELLEKLVRKNPKENILLEFA